MLAQALRIAVVLNELNLADALSPSMSPSLEGARVWSAVGVILPACDRVSSVRSGVARMR